MYSLVGCIMSTISDNEIVKYVRTLQNIMEQEMETVEDVKIRYAGNTTHSIDVNSEIIEATISDGKEHYNVAADAPPSVDIKCIIGDKVYALPNKWTKKKSEGSL